WQDLARQVGETRVGKVSTEKTLEQEQLADANALVEDLHRLGAQATAQRSEILRARRDSTMPADAATEEVKRLEALYDRVQLALGQAIAAADRAAKAAGSQASGGIRPLLEQDLADARRLDKASHALAVKLAAAGEQLAQASIDRLYDDT